MKIRNFVIVGLLALAFVLSPDTTSAQTPIVTVLYPNGGETWPLVGSQTISWSAPSLATSSEMQIELIPVFGATIQCPIRAYTAPAPGILNSGQFTISVNVNPYCRGQYTLRVGTWQSNVFFSDISDSSFTISETAPITVSSPNGGEVWQLQRTHSILWLPYNPGWYLDGATNSWVYNPELAVNPASTTVAYLQKLVDNNFVTVGKIVELGKASIYFHGYLVGEFQEPILVQPDLQYPPYYTYDPPPFLATPGQYYVKAVNKATGAWDRSDQPFTLVPENFIWADLKINGVDVNNYTPTIVPEGQVNTDYLASWTSNSQEKCYFVSMFFSRPYNEPGESDYQIIEGLPASGSRTFKVFPFATTTMQSGAYGWVSIGCPTSMVGSGIEGGGYESNALLSYESIFAPSVASVNGSNFVKVTAPNTGVGISWSNPYQITWETSADVETMSVALYKNAAFYKWIARDWPAQIKSYRWTPSATLFSSEVGSNFQISLIGRKQNQLGVIIQDKSDKPFSIFTDTGGGGGGGSGTPKQQRQVLPMDYLMANLAKVLSALSVILQNLRG